MKKTVCILFAILLSNVGYSQLSFSDRVKYSNSANAEDKSLFLIDFWATWCGPCVFVAKYLNILQEEFPEDLYIVSLTYQNKDLVAKFLEKHPTELAVSIDDERKNFDKYGIHALPHGILFNAAGEIVWRGNPADLKSAMLKRFLRQNPSTIPIADFIAYNAPRNKKVKNSEVAKITTTKNYDFFVENDSFKGINPLITKDGTYTVVKGTLSQVIAYLMVLNQSQVKSDIRENETYTVFIKDGEIKTSGQSIAKKILREKGLTFFRDTNNGNVIKISLPESSKMYWNTGQIDWGNAQRPAFMVNESYVKGDNLSLASLIYKMSNLLHVPFIVEGDDEKNEVYDWNVHYKYPNLMFSNFERLGIKAESTKMQYPIYTIKKR